MEDIMILPENAMDIPRLVEEGKTVREVAEIMGASQKTIFNYIKRLRAKGIEVKTRRGRRPIQL